MKQNQNKIFKVIPFCLSLLIVILLTGGIALYTTYGYDQTKYEFVDGYLGLENNQNLPAVDYLNKSIALESAKYADASTVVDLNYRDPSTKAIYNENGINSGDNKKGTYKNGIMHVKGYFDIYLSATISENKNDNGEVVKEIAYTFFFFNVDYTNLGFTSSGDAQKRLFVTFVEGIDSRSADDYNNDETKYGDAALEELSYTGVDSPASGYLYSYSNESGDFGFKYQVFDKGATYNSEKMQLDSVTDPICILATSNVFSENGLYLDEQESVTFAIYLLNSDGELEKTVIEGTIDNIITSKELNEETEKKFNKGYAQNLQAVPTFINYTWKTIGIFTAIAFAISLVLAVLFYSFWIDEKVISKYQKNNKK